MLNILFVKSLITSVESVFSISGRLGGAPVVISVVIGVEESAMCFVSLVPHETFRSGEGLRWRRVRGVGCRGCGIVM